jgi:hypothetical protein
LLNVSQNDHGSDALSPSPLHSRLIGLKGTTVIARRIPKGARIVAADALAVTIDAVTKENSFSNWQRLLLFSANCFQMPLSEPARKGSLTSLIKNNIMAFLEKRDIASPAICPKKRRPSNTDYGLGKRVQSKISEGDISGAVRLISSNDTIAPNCTATLEALKSKHPDSFGNEVFPSCDAVGSSAPLQSTPELVRSAIVSFPAGSAGGMDLLRPQHLKDMITVGTGDSGTRVLKSLSELCNLMLKGLVPQEICPVLYGASLCALLKKDGGIRPIAVGCVFRRLVAKLCSRNIMASMGTLLRPTQLGFGTKGGAEAAAHAARLYVSHEHVSPRALLKMDFVNAFNAVRRDHLLHCILSTAPEIYPFLFQCYREPSVLGFGTECLSSQRGVQQGDPLGPALFCLATHFIARQLQSQFNVWYLDDATVADQPDIVLQDLSKVVSTANDIGLELNYSKCEVIFLNHTEEQLALSISQFQKVAPGISLVRKDELTLLGAPLTIEAISNSLEKKTETLTRLCSRLELIPSHCAFFLMKHSLAIPKLVYLLRCSPTWECMDRLQDFDKVLKTSLESLINIQLNDSSWCQISLPVVDGGLGIRHATDLALPAFLASVASVTELLGSILPQEMVPFTDPLVEKGVNLWKKFTKSVPPESTKCKFQKEWELPQMQRHSRTLFDSTTTIEHKARLLGVTGNKSGAWLNALPSPTLGTLLDNDSFRVAIALRIGAPICCPHTCQCGASVNTLGTHGLSCRFSAGRRFRHAEVNDLIRRAFVSAGIPSLLEPSGVSRDDGKRPDGLTLVPWSSGKSLVWDFTCVDTLAPSRLITSATSSGSAATGAERKKIGKYKNLPQQFIFTPVGIETLGAWGQEAYSLIQSIGKKICKATGESRSTAFLVQRISIAVQRGNAASILGSLPKSRTLKEVLHLP